MKKETSEKWGPGRMGSRKRGTEENRHKRVIEQQAIDITVSNEL